jgi:hypothetical protein
VILVDTSVWIDHLRRSIPDLMHELQNGTIASHPFVVGELALGHFRNRDETVDLLRELPGLKVAAHDEVLEFVLRHDLPGRGIGWIDAHLLCAAHANDVPIWTHDRRLGACAAKLRLASHPPR